MFHGSITALVTPMQADGVLDIDSFRHMIEWQIEQGTNALVVLGSTGESPTIHPEERKLLIQQAKEQINNRIPLIVGTGTNSTESTIHYTKAAMEQGADACLIVTPYYNKPTQEGLVEHFKAVAMAAPLPQILYNVPSRTACDLKPETFARLFDLPNIVGLKDATGDLNRLQEILSFDNDSIDLFSGDDATAMEYISNGGRGVISVTSNVAPKLMSELCEAALAGNFELANERNEKMALFHKVQGIETNPIPVKWALNAMKMIPPGIRLPLTPLSLHYHDTIKSALSQANILV